MIKIGKIGLFFLFFVFFKNLAININNIILTDINYNVIKKVRALDPFILLIKNDNDNKLDYIDLDGLEDFQILKNGKNFDSKTNSYNYYFILKTKKSGKYNLRLKDPNKGDILNFQIVAKEPRVKSNIIFVQNNKEFFADQKIDIILRFIYKDDKLFQFTQELIYPEAKDFDIKFSKNLRMYKTNIKNKVYQVIDMYGYISFQNPGKYLLENLFGKFIRKTSINNVNGLFKISMQSSNYEYWPNKPVEFDIKELPIQAKDIDLIGEITEFNISLEKYNLNKEEPVLMNFNIKGNANLSKLNKLNLNIPDSITVFDPKTEFSVKDNQEIKRFQYVIQPMIAGQIEIPAQDLLYFDPKDKVVKKISTSSVKIKVQELNNIENKVKDKKELESDNHQYKDIIEKNLNLKYIPWNIFFILLFLPLGFLLINKKNSLFIFYKNYIKHKLFGYSILNKAIKKVDILKKEKKSSLLYLNLKNSLLSFILKKDIEDLDKSFSDQEILNILIKNNVDKDIIENYKNLIEELIIYSNYGYIKSESDNNKIFEKVKEFLISLKKNKKFKKTKFIILLLIGYSNFNKADNNLENLYRARKNATTYDRLKIDKIISQLTGTEIKVKKNLDYFLNLIPILYWQIIFIILWIILILALNKNIKLKLFVAMLLILSGIFLSLISYEKFKLTALIEKEDIKIYLGPDQKYPVKKKLEKFIIVKILKENKFDDNSWFYIEDNKEKGWIKSENVTII